ncbi:hypothetical protein KP509_02G101700 [Ceratopteris richardii]|uniref:Uncharacterized protein n=1 Tax=Ceratopteris richardii TaxID=49495 RepID=A0A8T2VH70_CERRI|nr:hypothetical protein KP509_02G101700 [Ceratopteris richardii]
MIVRTSPAPVTSDFVREFHSSRSSPFGDGFLPVQQRKSKSSRVSQTLSSLQKGNETAASESLQEDEYESLQKAQVQMELLKKLKLRKSKDVENTIGDKLAKYVDVDSDDEVVIKLGKQQPLEYDDLTTSQKRNIRRQKYLDQVSKRNDAPFFTAVALFVVVPPVLILGWAIVTGYVNVLP